MTKSEFALTNLVAMTSLGCHDFEENRHDKVEVCPY